MLGHLISFRSDCEPRILFWKNDELCELELMGKELNIRFSDVVLCTGYQTLETGNSKLKTYSRCPHKLKGRKQCAHCRSRDISRIYTRLDFEGYEELKDAYVHQKFSVYLAAFGSDIVKCGVTRSERVEERTYEQGADYWVELMRFDNGEEAYDAEIGLQNRFSLRNFVRNDTKLALLNKPKSQEMLEAKIKEIRASGLFVNNFCESVIRENVYPVPSSFELSYAIDGFVTSSKSQMLFYNKNKKDFVVPMYAAIGRVFLLKEIS